MPDSSEPYGKQWTKAPDMAGTMLFSCPEHTSLREATSPEHTWRGKWQLVDKDDEPLICDLCASEERMFGKWE